MGRLQKHNHILLIRPLINISKDQILNYLEKDKVSFVEDESNDDDGYSRNYIKKILSASLRVSGLVLKKI